MVGFGKQKRNNCRYALDLDAPIATVHSICSTQPQLGDLVGDLVGDPVGVHWHSGSLPSRL